MKELARIEISVRDNGEVKYHYDIPVATKELFTILGALDCFRNEIIVKINKSLTKEAEEYEEPYEE